jgi:hypothetical protein
MATGMRAGEALSQAIAYLGREGLALRVRSGIWPLSALTVGEAL